MSGFSFTACLLALAAVFGVLNHRLLRMPASTGVMVIALVVSLLLLLIDPLVTGHGLQASANAVLAAMHLPDTLMNGALAFLLFAGSLHVDLRALWQRRWTVGVLATLGVILAVPLFALGIHLIFGLCGLAVPFIWCLVLGAIIAPTDPVSVVGLLKRLGLPIGLRTIFAGESLFNDGVGVVVFAALLTVALSPDAQGFSFPADLKLIGLFAGEAAGGIVLGLALGAIALLLMRQVEEVTLELLISLALAMGSYSLGQALHLSGPIAAVIAGLVMGSEHGRGAISEAAHAHVMSFWSLIDELLNILLFLLIGLEVLAVPLGWPPILAAALAIPLALVARGISIAIPSLGLRLAETASLPVITLLAWGGLRGGISVALALNLPEAAPRHALLPVCYAVVVFSVVVQGLTMPALLRRLGLAGESTG